MSQATPMSTTRRLDIYRTTGRGITARQHRQFRRMAARQTFRAIGAIPPSGATGARTRRPIPRPGLTPERGSITTHVAVYCAPCEGHGRTRLHQIRRTS